MSDANVLFTVEPEKREKKPTLLQFLKLHGKKKLANGYPVLVIWTPGKFPEYGFETEHFRCRISESNPVFSKLRESLDGLRDAEIPLAIRVGEGRDGQFDLIGLDPKTNNVSWVEIGSYGYRIEYPK